MKLPRACFSCVVALERMALMARIMPSFGTAFISSGEMSYFKDVICRMSSIEREEICSSSRLMLGSGMVKEGADKSDSLSALWSSALLRASCLRKVIVNESAVSSWRFTSLLMVFSWVKTGDSLIDRTY